MPPHRLLLSALAALALLAACTGDRMSAPSAPAASAAPAPPEPMPGRWLLTAAGSGQCHVTFGGAAGAGEGTIAPEGGCPANFFTSRKWTFEQGSLVIRDHTGAPLAQLAQAGPGRFEGQATGGLQMTLTR